MAWELQMLDAIQTITNPILDVIMKYVTLFGDKGIFWFSLALLLLIIPKTRRAGLCLLFSLLIEALICDVTLKKLVARVRPYEVNTQIQLIVKRLSDYSFPSGHTGLCFAGAVSFLLSEKNKKPGVLALILAVLVAFSRLYLYVHYPTDVLAGIVVGVVSGIAGAKLGDWLYKKRRKQ